MKGILPDANAIGQVHALVQRMQAEPWLDFPTGLGLVLKRFEDVGLSPTFTDFEIWRTCQTEDLILITDNRNQDSPDSLEATIRKHNQPDSLPVFTIADLDKFQDSRAYAERVLEQLYAYLLRIDELRGTGRLYLPEHEIFSGGIRRKDKPGPAGEGKLMAVTIIAAEIAADVTKLASLAGVSIPFADIEILKLKAPHRPLLARHRKR